MATPVTLPEAGTPPLFICGNARGGTTLLVRLLDGHPDLLVLPTETQIYPVLATRWLPRILLRMAELAGWRSSVGMLANPALARLAFRDREALTARVRVWVQEYGPASSLDDSSIDRAVGRVEEPRQYWEAFLHLFSQLSGNTASGKSYWVEKTPRAERFALVSDAWFGPGCRFLHVIRDPRDFIASYLVRETRLRGIEDRGREIVRLCYSWSQSVAWCDYNMRAIVGRYHALRYEDLVADPRRTMSAACSSIGISSDDRLLRATRMGEQVRLNSSDLDAPGAPGEIVRTRVGRFADTLSAAEVRRIESLLGRQMEACGYTRNVESEAISPMVDGVGLKLRLLALLTARSQAASRIPFLGR